MFQKIRSKHWALLATCLAPGLAPGLALVWLVQLSLAQQEPAAPQTQPAASGAEASSDEVIEELLQDRQGPPLIEPTRQLDVPVAGVEIDPRVIGLAPGSDLPPLRREGSFIVNRRGRMVRSPGGHQLFVFEADASQSPELPTIMQFCRMLESMEEIVRQRGDAVVFVISGQIHTYRGANYLLPTMMKIAIDKGNLEN